MLPIRRSLALTALFAAALAVAGCGGIGGFGGMGANNESNIQIGASPYVEGSGTVVTRTRDAAAFHRIRVDNGITVFVTRGDKPSVAVTADDNLVEMITTDVSDDVMAVRVNGSLRTHHKIEVKVTAAETVTDVTAGNGSTVDFESIEGESFAAIVVNGATFRGGGKTTNLVLTVDGGSTGDLRNVEAETATVTVSGGSTAFVRASQAVAGTCQGGSTTIVRGNPASVNVQKDTGSTVKSE